MSIEDLKRQSDEALSAYEAHKVIHLALTKRVSCPTRTNMPEEFYVSLRESQDLWKAHCEVYEVWRLAAEEIRAREVEDYKKSAAYKLQQKVKERELSVTSLAWKRHLSRVEKDITNWRGQR